MLFGKTNSINIYSKLIIYIYIVILKINGGWNPRADVHGCASLMVLNAQPGYHMIDITCFNNFI